MKHLKIILTVPFMLASVLALADNHSSGPLGYGISYTLNVSDPAAIAGVMTEVRTSELGENSPSSVALHQLVAGGKKSATHAISVVYRSAENIDKSYAMSQAMNVGTKVGPVMRAASEGIDIELWTVSRTSSNADAVTADNPVSMAYLLNVTDPAAFMSAFDPVWESVTKSFPGNVAFGTFLANGASPATHWINFTANDMATLLNGMQAMQESPAMMSYGAEAASFRSIVGEAVNRRLLAFPESTE